MTGMQSGAATSEGCEKNDGVDEDPPLALQAFERPRLDMLIDG